jgi:hypothetical protein
LALLRRDVGGADHLAPVSISTLINSSVAAHRL